VRDDRKPLLAVRWVPDFDGSVLSGGREALTVLGKGDAIDRAFVSA
jgi:hypothetical protein